MELPSYSFLWVFHPLKCPLARLGLVCPTCGLGRSIIAALRGDFSASFDLHFAGMPILILAALTLGFLVFNPKFCNQSVERLSIFFKGRTKLKIFTVLIYCFLSLCQKI